MVSGLESANLKLIRAAEQIEAIRHAVMEYTADEPSAVTKHSDGSHELNFVKPPPPHISILAGEVVYQIRSALDHLAFELVKLNPTGIALPADWHGKCAFPMWLDTPKKKPVFNCFKNTLPGITEGAFTFIDSVQPYNRRGTGNVLRLLAVLSNIDKHRHLNITKPQALRRDEAVVLYKGQIFINDSLCRVEDGAKTDSPFVGMDVKEVKVEGAFQPFVSFHESALGEGAATLPVEQILETCLNTVRNEIVPVFAQLLNNP